MPYTPQVLDHAQHPRNVGYIEGADGRGQYGDPDCGDFAIMTLEVQNNRITQCKYLVRGCGAAMATCSVISELALRKTITEAEQITDEKVVNVLGGLPPAKLHCSLLAASVLHNALADYRERHRMNLQDWRALYRK